LAVIGHSATGTCRTLGCRLASHANDDPGFCLLDTFQRQAVRCRQGIPHDINGLAHGLNISKLSSCTESAEEPLVRGNKLSEIVDLRPLLEKTVRAAEHPGEHMIKTYLKPLRWLSNTLLLVGVNSVLEKGENVPLREPFLAYVIDPDEKRVVRSVDEKVVKSRYGIDLETQDW